VSSLTPKSSESSMLKKDSLWSKSDDGTGEIEIDETPELLFNSSHLGPEKQSPKPNPKFLSRFFRVRNPLDFSDTERLCLLEENATGLKDSENLIFNCFY
jgi:hypothetical protein